MRIMLPKQPKKDKWFFMDLTSEEFVVGFFPRFGFSIRWKDAADGRTWVKPTFHRISYSMKRN